MVISSDNHSNSNTNQETHMSKSSDSKSTMHQQHPNDASANLNFTDENSVTQQNVILVQNNSSSNHKRQISADENNINKVLKHKKTDKNNALPMTAENDGDDSSRGGNVMHDQNSRGAAGKTRKIQSYFAPTHGEGEGRKESAMGATGGSLFHSASSAQHTVVETISSISTFASSHQNNNDAVNMSSSPTVPAKKSNVKQPNSSSTSSSNNSISTNSNTTNSNNVSIIDLKKQLEHAKILNSQLESKVLRHENDLKGANDRHKLLEDRNVKICKMLEDARRAMSIQDARRKRDQLALDCVRLGKITSMRTSPTSFQDVWEEGYALKDLSKRSCELLERKEELEKRKKRLQNAKRIARKGNYNSSSNDNGMDDNDNLATSHSDAVDFDLYAEADAIRSHMEQLKKDEIALAEEKRLLEGEKAAHQKELKRCQNEDRSRFYRDLQCLNSRYLLLSLLGRGGFSEVWKALDLLELREVAVKVHQLNPTWTEERKSSYIKHVTREYNIHRDMRHPRVVQLYDVFEIDVNSFATVLEYCKGIDLDEKLKRARTIAEKDARTVLLQIMSGLKYLNTPGDGDEDGKDANYKRRMAIIHFDLKPANILFDETGDAKITDFGLSKIIDDSNEGTSLELTSQGAGTYWYLPPEVFQKGDDGQGPPRISSKVDVWSVGVIFFQMLYGKRPFGEGKSQERVLSENIMLNATQVDFPADPKAPKVSDEAKDLIRACLTYDQKHRPDVHQLVQHPYLKPNTK